MFFALSQVSSNDTLERHIERMYASFYTINMIVNKAADAKADQVAVNAPTIVNEVAHSVAG
jgi:hypothetical protein